MFKIGVVGGIACGKSTVTNRFKELGCGAINADEIAHEVINMPEIVDQMRARWQIDELGYTRRSGLSPCMVLASELGVRYSICKEVNRKAVAEIVFKHPSEREFLETIMHPIIDARIRESLSLYSDVYIPAVILDIPLLFEGHWHKLCDYIIFVARDEIERARGYMKRNRNPSGFGSDYFTEEDIDKLRNREAFQWPLEKKKAHCHTIINNNTSLDDLHKKIDDRWEKIKPQILAAAPINKFLF